MASADPQARIATLEAALRTASRELHWANLTVQKKDAEIQWLQERLRKQRIGFLGPSSETLSDLQLELLTEQEPGATREELPTIRRILPNRRSRTFSPGGSPHRDRCAEMIHFWQVRCRSGKSHIF